MSQHQFGPRNVVIGLGWIGLTVLIAEAVRMHPSIAALGVDKPILYLIVFASLPTLAVGVIVYAFTALLPGFDGLLNIGNIGKSLALASARPGLQAKNRYVEWRRPEKPSDSEETVVGEVEVKWFSIELEDGNTAKGNAYQIEKTPTRFHVWSADGTKKYGLEDIFEPKVNRDQSLSVMQNKSEWGWDLEDIKTLNHGPKRTDEVRITCELSYYYRFFFNDWAKIVDDYTVEVEEDIAD